MSKRLKWMDSADYKKVYRLQERLEFLISDNFENNITRYNRKTIDRTLIRVAVAEVMEARVWRLKQKVKKLLRLDQAAGSKTTTANKWQRFQGELEWFQEKVTQMESDFGFFPTEFPWRQPLSDAELQCKQAECIQTLCYNVIQFLKRDAPYVLRLTQEVIDSWKNCYEFAGQGNQACHNALQQYYDSKSEEALENVRHVVNEWKSKLHYLQQRYNRYRNGKNDNEDRGVDAAFSKADSEEVKDDSDSDVSVNWGRGSRSDDDGEDGRWPSDYSDEDYSFSDDDSGPAARGSPDGSAIATRGTYHSVTTGGRSWMLW